ncbi:MAG: permease-like cell division protein FtsX [Candidatus Shapirobacteria bacterium]|nr:permease-like cell division protein FtsX [Candidatus Shapirobacteria bacterium]MDD5074160.1 permease-like cell division protein FtsX [Candidatus Shapirobacteria bacterium]MDD5481840.1 permease-like cell division protein FtsX [Candidatus Shapirobacteria bacterium]
MKSLLVALSHIRRSPYQSLLVVMVLSFAFFLISSFATLSFISQRVLAFFESQPQVIAYLKDSAPKEEIDSLISRLEATEKVEEVAYVSKEEALKIYQDANKDNPLLLEMVTAEILPASIEVSTFKIDHLKEIADILEQETIISVSEGGRKEIDFAENIAESLKDWTRAIRRVGLGGGVLLVVQSFLLMIVVTSMKIALRKDEVEILKLLGASSWQARSPFLIEGIIYGVLGAILGFSGMYLALTQLGQALIGFSFFADIGVFPVSQQFLLLLLGGTALFSSFICGLGSYVATRRYLR